jgi:hypothetical protein
MKQSRTQGAAVLAFRIFVMLSCLIVVPLAAIFGSAFPDVVKSLLVDRVVEWATGKSPDSTPNARDDEFGTVAPVSPGDAGEGSKGNSEAPRWDVQGSGTSWQGSMSGPPSTGVIPAAATLADPSAGNQPASHVAPIGPSPYPPSPNSPRDQHSESPSAGSPQPAGPADAVVRAGQSLQQPDPFTAMERKLRQYGATYYLLETWGNNGELFRFHCKMAIGNNPNYTRHFEATDRDALRAMSQVLERVETWRAGRPQ